MSEAPFARVVREALHQSRTRDPFDRLIVANGLTNALVENLPLFTSDDGIRAHCSPAFWQ